jgi:hypothetical protein
VLKSGDPSLVYMLIAPRGGSCTSYVDLAKCLSAFEKDEREDENAEHEREQEHGRIAIQGSCTICENSVFN